MAKKLYEESSITEIGRAIQIQRGTSSSYSVAGMAAEILAIKSQATLQSLFASVNGEFTPESGVDGFSTVVVSVPTETSVVLSTLYVSENHVTYAGGEGLDGFDQVIVSVPAEVTVSLISESFSSSGTYNAEDYSADGFSQVVITMPTVGLIAEQNNSIYYPPEGYVGFDAVQVSISGAGQDHTSDLVKGTLVSFENSIMTSMRECAFFKCSSLNTVSLPNVGTIKSQAFAYCNNLSTVHFPNASCIERSAFMYCYGLVSGDFPSCTFVGKSAFYHAMLSDGLSLPMCQQVEIDAFNGTHFESIALPSCTSASATGLFYSCSKLQTVEMPLASQIGFSAFAGCSKLTTVSLPEATEIMNEAFQDCVLLSSILLPKLSYFGYSVFKGCVKLESVMIPYTSYGRACATIPENAFENTPITDSSYLGYFGSIYVASTAVENYQSMYASMSWVNRITAYTA